LAPDFALFELGQVLDDFVGSFDCRKGHKFSYCVSEFEFLFDIPLEDGRTDSLVVSVNRNRCVVNLDDLTKSQVTPYEHDVVVQGIGYRYTYVTT
jgi:hypothetical protein